MADPWATAGTMHPVSLPGVDDQILIPEDLSEEDLEEYLVLMAQSNESVRAENDLLETYLANTDSVLIENIDTILEAATAAIHKAERTVQLGVMASVTTLSQTSKAGQESSTTTPRSSGQSHTGGSSAKVAAFTLSDKGPKIQPSQKMEIIQREMDLLKASYEEDKANVDKHIFSLQCKNDGSIIRLREIETVRKQFDESLEKEWVDRRTLRVPGEKMIAYFENRNKADILQIKAFKIRRKNLRIQLDAVSTKIKELGEELKYVDYEKLLIQDQRAQKNVDNTMEKLTELKKTNTTYQTSLSNTRHNIVSKIKDAEMTESKVAILEQKINCLLKDESRTLNDYLHRQQKIDQDLSLAKRYTAPLVMDYIRHTADVVEMWKAVKCSGRNTRYEGKNTRREGDLAKVLDMIYHQKSKYSDLRQMGTVQWSKVLCESLSESVRK